MFGQEEMPLSISEDEEVIHIIEVFLIIYHDLFCQRLWKNLIVKCVHIMFLKCPWPHTIYVQFQHLSMFSTQFLHVDAGRLIAIVDSYMYT